MVTIHAQELGRNWITRKLRRSTAYTKGREEVCLAEKKCLQVRLSGRQGGVFAGGSIRRNRGGITYREEGQRRGERSRQTRLYFSNHEEAIGHGEVVGGIYIERTNTKDRVKVKNDEAYLPKEHLLAANLREETGRRCVCVKRTNIDGEAARGRSGIKGISLQEESGAVC